MNIPDCDGDKSFCICKELDIGCSGMNVYVFDQYTNNMNFLPICAIIRFRLSKKSDIELVSKNGMLLKYIEKQTTSVCMTAINNNIEAINFIKDSRLKEMIKKISGV